MPTCSDEMHLSPGDGCIQIGLKFLEHRIPCGGSTLAKRHIASWHCERIAPREAEALRLPRTSTFAPRGTGPLRSPCTEGKWVSSKRGVCGRYAPRGFHGHLHAKTGLRYGQRAWVYQGIKSSAGPSIRISSNEEMWMHMCLSCIVLIAFMRHGPESTVSLAKDKRGFLLAPWLKNHSPAVAASRSARKRRDWQ